MKKSFPRYNSPEYNNASFTELNGLLQRGAFSYAYKDYLPTGSNVIGGRFIIAI